MILSKENLKKYYKSDYFFNRELSWLEFNKRVLEEAMNPELPLLEKIKFLSIFSSNLDEFYMIRVSGLKEQIQANIIEEKIDGSNPYLEIKAIEKEVQPMLNTVYTYWHEYIIPELRKNNIFIYRFSELNLKEQESLTDYFKKEIFPVLTPLAFDPGRPFPYISNLSLSFAVLVQKQNGDKHFARVKIPNILPRLLPIPDMQNPSRKTKKFSTDNSAQFIWIGDLIKENLSLLFPGMEIIEAHRFRITRDTDLEIQEDEADDLLDLIEENIKQRKFGSVVRLEIEETMPEFMIETLTKNLEISDHDYHILPEPLGMSALMNLYDLPFPHLKEKPFHPVSPAIFEEGKNIFTTIKEKDILIHHPYESFNPVIDFIKKAAEDPNVLAIKQTLYRVGQNSPIVKSLIEASERKKQVAVLVELKARFDEENNIYWARELEKAGVHVVYGLVGLKTHSKMTLVVRKELDGVKRYVHLGTGNYNSMTSKIYTDFGFFTINEEICSDVSDVFNFLTGYSAQNKFKKLLVAPITLRQSILKLIEEEIEITKKGEKGHIILKMNALVDPQMISALYEASNNGVKVDLIIRGICCLIPQLKGLSENISVRSIVGRFLEHSRILYFRNGGNKKIYLGSADLMQRNLDRRVEVVFPIEDEKLKRYIYSSILVNSLEDNVKARILQPTGKYLLNNILTDTKPLNSQEWFIKNAQEINKKLNNKKKK